MSGPRPDDSPGVRRAWGWVSHLLAGGGTPWQQWAGLGEQRGRVLPGAQQLELLRRLNLAGPPSPELARRVLDASAPGRGRPDLELAGAVEPLAFGPRPVDPADLPDDELVRVATSLIADDVVAAGLPDNQAEPARIRLWRTRYRLVGDPELADPMRAELLRRGRPPGGRGATVLVLGTHTGQLMVDAWTSRCFDEGAPPWRDWLGAAVRRDRMPPRVDLVRAARTWSATHPGRVRVVLDPGAVPRLVGVRRALPAPTPVSADAVDLARRVTVVLGLLAGRDHRRALVQHTLRPWLAAIPGPSLVVGEQHAEWLEHRAVRMRAALSRAGYPVHGDLDALLPPGGATEQVGVADPTDTGTLALAMRLLLDEPVRSSTR